MRLILVRQIFTEQNTIGKLYIDFLNGAGKQYICDTLEDKYRDITKEPKVYGQTAIPFGVYKVKNVFSQRFQVVTPLLFNVKDFNGIRIHSGNTEADTEGCVLVGTAQGNKLINSFKAYNLLWSFLGKISDYEIEITK